MPLALITGTGMLATALAARAPVYGWHTRMLPHATLDITDGEAVLKEMVEAGPSLILHTAALTRVDYCEDHPDEAYFVNAHGTQNVVNAARAIGARIIYFSTDYVFDGRQQAPLLENDLPAPLNVYGATKLAGEQYAGPYEKGHVVRTSGIFGPRLPARTERNFFCAIWNQLDAGKEDIRVVDDQVTAVTYAPHLADMLWKLLTDGLLPRTVHLTSSGVNSWWGWARSFAELLGRCPAVIKPVSSAEYGGQAKRAAFSVLASSVSGIAELVTRYSAVDGLGNYLRTRAGG